jgi:hypothetical protein
MLFFDIKFFKYFFRVLHEASSSWIKVYPTFLKHPIYKIEQKKIFKTETTLPFQLIKDFCKRSLICNYDEFQKFKIQIYKGHEKKNSTGRHR